MASVDELIQALGLEPHPEGGHFVETHREDAGTAIYYLLAQGEVARWHRVDRTEIWHWYDGAPLELSIAADATPETHVLGPDVRAGQRPQVVIPAHQWQSARTLGGHTLVGCTVTPAFTFDGFELAPDGWEP